jgi:uncharacterized protein involved in response to NO
VHPPPNEIASKLGTSRMDQRDAPPPFAIMFPLAAIDAVAGGCGWLAALFGRLAHWSIADVAEWHQNELLFGFVSAAMAGFLFTALPRWTGRPVGNGAVRAFTGAWAVARIVPSQPWLLDLLQSAPSALLAVVTACHVIAARDRRNRKTVALLALYAASGIMRFGPFDLQIRNLGAQVALAAVLGLAMLIGGRVLPALAARFDALRGETAVTPQSASKHAAIEAASAALAVAAIASQWLAPEAAWTPPALLFAGVAQFWRMASWIGRRTFEAPSLVGLFAAHVCIPLGFILLAAHGAAPRAVPTALAVHVWAIGGLGGMILAIMSSMIRKRCGLAFTASPGGDAAAALCLVAAAARAGAAFEPRLLPIAANAWSAAFCLFLFAFRAPLFEAAVKTRPRARPSARPRARRRRVRTESHS